MSREVELARAIWETKQAVDEQADKMKALQQKQREAEEQLRDYLITEGKNSTGHIAGVGVFSLRRENYPSVAKANLPNFISHLREIGDDSIVEETIPAQTLKSYLKGKLEKLTETFIDDEEEMQAYEKELGIEPGTLSPAKLAVAVYQRYGVSVFEDIKLSHTKKGK